MSGESYKVTCYVMTGVIITGVAAWLTFAQNKITREELVQARSEDRQYVQELKTSVDQLDATVRRLDGAVIKLSTILEMR